MRKFNTEQLSDILDKPYYNGFEIEFQYYPEIDYENNHSVLSIECAPHQLTFTSNKIINDSVLIKTIIDNYISQKIDTDKEHTGLMFLNSIIITESEPDSLFCPIDKIQYDCIIIAKIYIDHKPRGVK